MIVFSPQRLTWASCPDWVQTMILKNIREIIKVKMQQEHRVREDRCEGFTDDWAAVAAAVQSQISSWAPTSATPRIQSQTPGNLGIGALVAPRVTNSIYKKLSRLSISARRPDSPPQAGLHRFRVKLPATSESGPWWPPLGDPFDSQETLSSFDLSQTATPLLSFLNSDPQTPDGLRQVAVGLTLDNTVTPTTLRQLALSIEDLESQEETATHSQPLNMEQGPRGSNDACT